MTTRWSAPRSPDKDAKTKGNVGIKRTTSASGMPTPGKGEAEKISLKAMDISSGEPKGRREPATSPGRALRIPTPRQNSASQSSFEELEMQDAPSVLEGELAAALHCPCTAQRFIFAQK
jgi:hypothetical protein